MSKKNQSENEIPVFVPPGFPDYLSFRPESDTIGLNNELGQQLNALERALSTSNHLQAHTLATKHLLPLFQILYSWTMAAQRDQLVHQHHIAEWLLEQLERPDYIDEETVEKFDQFFDAVTALTGLLKPVLKDGVASLAKLDEQGVTSLLALVKAKVDILDAHVGPLADVISEQAAPIDDEDEEDGADEGDDGAEDEDEDPDAPAVGNEKAAEQPDLFG